MRSYVVRSIRPDEPKTIINGITIVSVRPSAIETELAPPAEIFASVSREDLWLEEGYSFFTSTMVSIPSGGSSIFMFTASSAKTMHFSDIYLSTDAEKVRCDLIVGADLLTKGPAIPIYNSNFTDGTQSGCGVYGQSEYIGGEAIPIDYLGGGTFPGNARWGTIGESSDGLILKPDTTYYFAILNQGASQANVLCKASWYEVPRISL